MNWDNKTNKSFIKSTFILLIIFVLFLIGIDVYNLWDKTVFFIFQHRDIIRGRELLAGKLIFYGPEMTGGGNLPGSLYYVFIAFSQVFAKSWFSAWVMQLFLGFLACMAGYWYFLRQTSLATALLWILVFSLAPFTGNILKVFLNVSSMLLFNVLAIICIKKMYEENQLLQKTSKFFICSCFLIGLGLHFHFSIICLYFGLLITNLFAKKWGFHQLSKTVLIKGTCALFIPLLPYLIWLLSPKFGFQFGVERFYAGESLKAPLSLLHLMTYGYSEPLPLVVFSTFLVLMPFPLITVIPIWYFHKSKETRQGWTILKKNSPLLVCLGVSFIPVVELFFSPQAFRYLMPFHLTLVFIAMAFYDDLLRSKLKMKYFVISGIILQLLLWVYCFSKFDARFAEFISYQFGIIIFLLIVNYLLQREFFSKGFTYILTICLIVTLSHSQLFLSYNGSFSFRDWTMFMPKKNDWGKIWSTIYEETGWDYEKARGRIYYVGHHLEQSPDLLFENNSSADVVELPNVPDGFFVSNRFRTNWHRWKGNSNPAKSWLINQNLQPGIIQAIHNGQIKLGHNLSDEILIIPYWVSPNANLPKHFHNIGSGYRISLDDKKLKLISTAEGVLQVDQNQLLFKWNECPDQNEYCSTGAFVTYQKLINHEYKIDIKVIGATLSQITPWVSPNWTQAWIAPYLNVSCSSGEINKLAVASSIGFLRSNSHDSSTPILQGNNSFVGPFNMNWTIKCKGAIKEIELGRQSSLVEMITTVKELPAKALKMKF